MVARQNSNLLLLMQLIFCSSWLLWTVLNSVLHTSKGCWGWIKINSLPGRPILWQPWKSIPFAYSETNARHKGGPKMGNSYSFGLEMMGFPVHSLNFGLEMMGHPVHYLYLPEQRASSSLSDGLHMNLCWDEWHDNATINSVISVSAFRIFHGLCTNPSITIPLR